MLADFEVQKGEFEAAYEYLNKALQEDLKDNATNPWVSTALYKMGVVRLKQDKLNDAMFVHASIVIVAHTDLR